MEGIEGGWKLFGNQTTGSVGVNSLMCPGSNGVVIFYTIYVFGIAVGTGSELICN